MNAETRSRRVIIACQKYYDSLEQIPPELPISYSRGLGGLLVFAVWAECNGFGSGRSLRIAERLCQKIEKSEVSFGLYDGLCGALFALENYESFIGKPVDGLMAVRSQLSDSILAGFLDKEILNCGFDLISGSAGILLYFAKICVQPSRDSASYLQQLLFQACEYANGIPQWKGARNEGALDLGLAHGQAGPMASILAYSDFLSDDSAVSERILADLWSRKNFDGLPYSSNSGTSRVAWCYGELGIIGAWVALAGRARGDCRVLDAMFFALTSRIRSGTHGIDDGFFCHGASGAALLLADLRRYAGFEALDLERELVDQSCKYVLESAKSPHDSKNNHYALIDGLPGAFVATICASREEIPQCRAFAPALTPGSLRPSSNLM